MVLLVSPGFTSLAFRGADEAPSAPALTRRITEDQLGSCQAALKEGEPLPPPHLPRAAVTAAAESPRPHRPPCSSQNTPPNPRPPSGWNVP